MSKARSAERQEYLTDLLSTAIECGSYGFPGVIEYKPEAPEPFALITDRYAQENEEEDCDKVYRVSLDTIAHGLSVFRELQKSNEHKAIWVTELFLSDRTNGADGDYDVIGALAVLECALFGEVVYA